MNINRALELWFSFCNAHGGQVPLDAVATFIIDIDDSARRRLIDAGRQQAEYVCCAYLIEKLDAQFSEGKIDMQDGDFVINATGPRPLKTGDLREVDALRGLNAAIDLAHETAVNAGWYRDPETGQPVKRNFGEVVALMHSELSEALEHDRCGTMDDKLPHRSGVEVEFADCVIRIFDTARALGLDLAGAIIEKNRFNRQRADHKLEARAAAGGKRY